MHYIFFIHSAIDGHLGCFCHLAIMNNATVNTGIQISESLFPFLWDVYPEVESLNHIGILCLIFLKNHNTVFYSSFAIFISNIQRFQIFYIIINAYYFPFLKEK